MLPITQDIGHLGSPQNSWTRYMFLLILYISYVLYMDGQMDYLDGAVQDCSISTADALGIQQCSWILSMSFWQLRQIKLP